MNAKEKAEKWLQPLIEGVPLDVADHAIESLRCLLEEHRRETLSEVVRLADLVYEQTEGQTKSHFLRRLHEAVLYLKYKEENESTENGL